jgi:hypothetical protein
MQSIDERQLQYHLPRPPHPLNLAELVNLRILVERMPVVARQLASALKRQLHALIEVQPLRPEVQRGYSAVNPKQLFEPLESASRELANIVQ